MNEKISNVGRREFMAGAAALGVASLGTTTGARANAAPDAKASAPTGAKAATETKPYRIDVHHHFNTPQFVAATRERFMLEIGGMAAMARALDWTPENSLAEMDKAGIATAILSLNAPGPWARTREASHTLCRHCNEFATALTKEHPGRFGHFASLPLPDVENSLKEAVHALDVLKADGIMMLTNYDAGKWLGDSSFEGSKWLGDPSFWPIYEELNRRNAIVYTHPATPNCCQKMNIASPPALMEYQFDTARAIFNLIYSGAALRFPKIRFIFSHGGGTILTMLGRLQTAAFVDPKLAERVPQGTEYFLRKFFYDTVGVDHPAIFAALKEVMHLPQLLFGSDVPYRPLTRAVDSLHRLVPDPQELRQIERDNALALLPRFA